MPEFTDNLRTTKVLLAKFDRSSVVYDGARCSIARECIFPPEIVFYGRNSRIFHFFVEQRVLFKFHDEKFFVATQIAQIDRDAISAICVATKNFSFTKVCDKFYIVRSLLIFGSAKHYPQSSYIVTSPSAKLNI
jgi:hypothetical protein